MTTFLIVLVIGVGVGVYVLRDSLEKRPRRRREAALREIADRIGFGYDRDKNPFQLAPALDSRLTEVLPSLEHAFYGYPHFLIGNTSVGPTRIFDVWHGSVGGGRGKSEATSPYKQTLVAFHVENMNLPAFTIVPEGRIERANEAVFSLIRKATGSDDLDFHEHPVFSGRYALRGKDQAATRALFGHELIAFWEALPVEERWAAAGAGKSLIIYRYAPWSAGRQREVAPEALDSFLKGAETLATAFSHRALKPV